MGKSRTSGATTAAHGRARTGLLPFLDIVFGTVGVFVVVFALQHVAGNRETTPAGVDGVVTCIDGDRLAAHWPDGESGPAAAPQRSYELLQRMAESGRPFRSLIVAIGPGCFRARRAFMEGYERFLELSPGPGFPDDRARADLMLELYPIGGAADAGALLDEWRRSPKP